MSADELIASLQKEGQLEARGEFKLDRAKARDKMRRFQLPDPQRYVLELVQAAYTLGATRVDFEIDADEMCVLFDGEHLTRSDLEDLYGAPFSNIRSTKTQALRHLAIGLTAGRALKPSVLTVESGSRDETFEQCYDPKSQEETIVRPAKPWAHGLPKNVDGVGVGGTRVYLKEEFRVSHLTEWFRGFHGDLAECAYLKKHCRRTPMLVTLNGDRVSAGAAFEEPDGPGAVVIKTAHETGTLRLVQGIRCIAEIYQSGVLVTTHSGFSDPVGYEAVVQSERLRRDLSQAAFIEDEAWKKLILTLTDFSRLAIVQKYQNLEREAWGIHHEDIMDIFATLVQQCVWAEALDRPFAPEVKAFLHDLAELPIWPVASEVDRTQALVLGTGVYLRFSQLPRPVLGSRGAYRSVDFGKPVVMMSCDDDGVYVGPLRLSLFEGFLGVKVRDVTSRLEDELHAVRNREAFEWASRSERLAEAKNSLHVSTEVEGLAVYVYSRPQGSELTFVREGKVLSSRALDSRFLPGIGVLVSGEIPVNRRWDGPQHNDQLSVVATNVIKLFPSLMSGFVKAFAKNPTSVFATPLRKYLEHLLRGRLHIEILEAFGLGSDAKLFMQAQPADSVWRLAERARDDDPDVLGRVDRLGLVADADLFELLYGERVSLARVREIVVSEGRMAVLHEKHLLKIREAYGNVATSREIMLTDDATEVMLSRLFGDRFLPAQNHFGRLVALDRFLAKPLSEFELPHPHIYGHVSKHVWGQAEIKLGMIWNESWGTDPDGHGVIATVLLNNRELAQTKASFKGGRFDAVVFTIDAIPSPDYDALDFNYGEALHEKLGEFAAIALEAWLEEVVDGGDLNQLPAQFWVSYRAASSGLLEDLKCFEDASGRRLSRREFEHEMGEKLYLVRPEATVRVSMVRGGTVLRWTRGAPLPEIFGCAYVDVSETPETAARVEAGKRAFEARPQTDMTASDGVTEAEQQTEGYDVRVSLHLDYEPHRTFRDVQTELYRARRLVGKRQYFVPFGCFRAMVNSDRFELGPFWTELVDVPKRADQMVREVAGVAMTRFARSMGPGGDGHGIVMRQMAFEYLVHAVSGVNNGPVIWPQAVEAFRAAPFFQGRDGVWVGYDRLVEHSEVVYGVLPDDLSKDVFGVRVSDQLTADLLRRLPGLNAQSVSEYFSQRVEPTLAPRVVTHASDPVETSGRVGPLESVGSLESERYAVVRVLRELFVEVRGEMRYLIDDGILQRLAVVDGSLEGPLTAAAGDQFLLNARHPVFELASENTQSSADATVAMALLASAVYSEVNRVRGEITDTHEKRFQLRLTDHVKRVMMGQ